MKNEKQILQYLNLIYPDNSVSIIFSELKNIIELYKVNKQKALKYNLTNKDIMLITYGDQVKENDIKPLKVLNKFCNKYISNVINCIHILPFYPYSSDDGFSVIDYKKVDSKLGNWKDIEEIGTNFKIMFDAVINHISAKSEWFIKYLEGEVNYKDFFIEIEGSPDLTKVTRPRALPLLSEFNQNDKQIKIWTTFSSDQIDLNYKNPVVLLRIIELLLFYAEKGAGFIRLDAIGYLWKEIGTSCIHLPQTHNVIKLLKLIFEECNMEIKLITETNVPHSDNLSYFGNGTDEADLVYNFALPPLTLHTFYSENVTKLSNWIKSLSLPSDKVTFFNFLASHDGIGINPVKDILTSNEIETIIGNVLKNGGLVSYKSNQDGTKSPYELNINFFDALSDPQSDESEGKQIDRIVASHAIMLSLIGLPGIYFHSLFGSRSFRDGVKITGINRTINREKLNYNVLVKELNDKTSLRYKVFNRLKTLIKARTSSDAFDPYGYQNVFDVNDKILLLLRGSNQSKEKVLCIQNISNSKQDFNLDPGNIINIPESDYNCEDLISTKQFCLNQTSILKLNSYETLWLKFQLFK